MKKGLIFLSVLLGAFSAMSQETYRTILLYGTVQTLDNSYTGYLRWNREELLETDFFNASKIDNDSYRRYRNQEKQRTSWKDMDWDIASIWKDNKSIPTHQFSTQFGNIREIIPLSGSRAQLTFVNGREMEVNGSGFNDTGSTVIVMDEELGRIKLAWNRIRRITLQDGGKSKSAIFGKPLYGTVHSLRKGSFTGLIQWDAEERVDTDKLNGSASGNKYDIAFGSIARIKKEGNGSLVTLRSGRVLKLTGSNDVNSENRGILVTDIRTGEIKIPWKAFDYLELHELPETLLPPVNYADLTEIKGTVHLHGGETYRGRLIYDLDESLAMETLEASDDEIVYRIPFYFIKEIVPRNYAYSMITTHNGDKLLLGNARDVSDKNDGVMITPESGKAKYVRWKDIQMITLD